MTESSWQQFVETTRKSHEQVQKELKEVDMLIQQTTSEVERLMQQNAKAAARTRQVEAQIDTVPRDEIKAAYNSTIENQQRLFTMRGQLEKLQSDQKNLSRLSESYRVLLDSFATEEIAESETEGEAPSHQTMVINIIEAQERERLRLSRQMHDGPAQALTNLVIQAEICERLFDRDPARAKTELAELKENVVSTFQKVKGFIFELRPMMLDDLGLVPTMKRYAEGLTESGFTGIVINVTGKDRRLARHKEVTTFRVTQELIHLGRENGRASSIKVGLDMGDTQVRVVVEDNGNGYELDEELTTQDALRLGLPTLRERIEMLKGTFSFDSSPGQGMRVTFTLPAEEQIESQ